MAEVDSVLGHPTPARQPARRDDGARSASRLWELEVDVVTTYVSAVVVSTQALHYDIPGVVEINSIA
jgi:hypothetical protein